DECIYAIGEVALHEGMLYGLVAPGYEMADVLANNLADPSCVERFRGSDLSAKLKLLGIDVATFGDPCSAAVSSKVSAYEDQVRGLYKKLVISDDGTRLVGGILVGDASDYGRLLHLTRSKTTLSSTLDELGIGGSAIATATASALPDEAQICSCNN